MKKTISLFLLVSLFSCFLQAQTPHMVVPIGHTGPVLSVAFSPDGKTVLTGSADKTAKLWDMSGRELQTFSGHASDVTSVAFSPDGKQVLTGSFDETAKLWDLSGRELQTFSGHTSVVMSVAFSPDGKQVLTGSDDNTAKLWDLSGRKLKTFYGHTDGIFSVAFSPDGIQVLTGSEDKTANLWDLSGRKLKTFSGHAFIVNSVAFSPNGNQVLTGSEDKTAKLWNLKGRALHTFSGHTGAVRSVAFSPDGKQVLTGCNWDETAKLWDLSGREILTFSGHANGITSVAFSRDGRQVLTGSFDKTAKLWDLTGREVQRFSGHASKITFVAFSPACPGDPRGGKQFLTGSSDKTAKLWDLLGRELRTCTGHTQPVISAAFSPDGNQALTGSVDNTVKLWDLTGRELQTFSGHASWVTSVAFSPDGNQVLTGSGDKTAKLWGLSGRELQTFSGHTEGVRSVAFSPDGQQVLTGSSDETAKLWDMSGKELQVFSGHAQSIRSVAFSPDGRQVLTGSFDNTAKLWDLSGRELQTFSGHEDAVWSVAFSPDGKNILTGSRDNTAKLWDLSGLELESFNGHNSEVLSVAYSPDGKNILTGSSDNTTKLWDTNSGKLLATLVALDSNNWVVTTPSGLFDASDDAKKMMYYVVDYEEEKIVLSLEQLQERYWQPGLLGAVMGLTPYPVKNVGDFDNLPLFPSIEDSTRIEAEHLYIKLRERNGGLGKLTLRINGTVRGKDLNPLPQRKKDLVIDLKPYSKHFHTDTINTIELEAYESRDYYKSEPYMLHYQPSVKGRGEGSNADKPAGNKCLDPRHLYLIIVGTSLYPQGVDSLPSANDDAIEMARVLSETGKLLYKDRVHLQLLSTKKGEPPSKANIAAAFEAFKGANLCDVLVVFFAGHGKSWGSDGDKSNFYYLTKDIGFGNLGDEGMRKQSAISDKELEEWMGKIPAENKLLILDACNSGQAAINMGGIISRDMDPDQIVAFKLMSGNTGSYVISGSSESGLSWESEVFGHGLLTYSLLEGINGTALDGSKVDVLPLLLKAYKRVEELAKNEGKEQTPIVAKPRGNASFFIGRNDGSVKIELPQSKPTVIRSTLFDKDKYNDALGLSEALNSAFRSKEMKGKQAQWYYSDTHQNPNGFFIRGVYSINPDGTVTVRGSLLKGETPVGNAFELTGSKDSKDLAELILKEVKQRIKAK